jgi:hypothetical protein
VTYLCCDVRRHRLVRDHPTLNGLEHLEVLDSEAPPGSPRQRTLLLRFLKPAPALTAANIEILGGDRIPSVGVLWVTPAAAPDAALVSPAEAAFLTALPEPDRVLALRTESSGDYSQYTLYLVAAAGAPTPPPGIDRPLSQVAFSFKVECPSDFDCAPDSTCPPAAVETPVLDYLAKDFGSLRRLMLDRMAQTIPDWRERAAADLGVTLVELLAYVGDRLSYAQDAVATEAYLMTARRRSSVRRHARLVDYTLDDGANARVLVQVAVEGGPVVLAPGEAQFVTRLPGVAPVIPAPATDPLFERLLMQGPLVFEPLHGAMLFPELNLLDFHDWGDGECCLPAGATRATLRGDLPMLAPGMILVFEEVIGPLTGAAADADPARRCAVRLTEVAAGAEDPVTDPPTPITEIRWADADALPFALCISARTAPAAGGRIVAPVSRVLGNIVVADHGLTRRGVPLGVVPEPHLACRPPADDRCDPQPPTAIPPRFRPVLPESLLAQAAPFVDPPSSATAALAPPRGTERPAIRLAGATPLGPRIWQPQRDLLGSRAGDEHFVVEVEADESARLRFGDDRSGRRPESGTIFTADYRIGNGPGGNIGADSLGHVATDLAGVVGLRNPMPATGGRAPESVAAARVAAPQAFRVQERAVTPADYAAVAQRYPGVQRAAATFRWNGHGHTVFVTVDRLNGVAVDPEFEDSLLAHLERYRLAGYDLEIDGPRYVPVDLALTICVAPTFFRAAVRAALGKVLSADRMPDGSLGLFHPDNFTFAQPVRLSAIIAAAQRVQGVESVTATRFRRLDDPDPEPLASGILGIGRLEIARLANDPDFPERGVLELSLGGGR